MPDRVSGTLYTLIYLIPPATQSNTHYTLFTGADGESWPGSSARIVWVLWFCSGWSHGIVNPHSGRREAWAELRGPTFAVRVTSQIVQWSIIFYFTQRGPDVKRDWPFHPEKKERLTGTQLASRAHSRYLVNARGRKEILKVLSFLPGDPLLNAQRPPQAQLFYTITVLYKHLSNSWI